MLLTCRDARRGEIAVGDKSNNEGWYLEGVNEAGEHWFVRISASPFTIGRVDTNNLFLRNDGVSRVHAVLEFDADGRLWLRDGGSTNGTFVNYQRLDLAQPVPLSDGDIIHFAKMAFRCVRREVTQITAPAVAPSPGTTLQPSLQLPETFVAQSQESSLREMLAGSMVQPFFQPIVRLNPAPALVAYELLGRGAHPALPQSPPQLLRIAHTLGRIVDLSELWRTVGVKRALELHAPCLFVNTVPAEMVPDFLRRSLGALRVQAPHLPVVLEVHEHAVADVSLMSEVRHLLTELDMQLAYDDFGAGQARLVELMEVPPEVLKYDIGLIRGIDRKPPHVQELVRDLVRMARSLGVLTLAEGIETDEEAAFCVTAGFDLGQGYRYGRPTPDPLVAAA